MTVTHDLIAAVQGPDWKFGLSRILIDDQGNGVVFIAGSQDPYVEFTATGVATSKGTGELKGDEGGAISWRRRGSSCQYKLAKCKVNTATLEGWWAAYRADMEHQQSLDDLL